MQYAIDAFDGGIECTSLRGQSPYSAVNFKASERQCLLDGTLESTLTLTTVISGTIAISKRSPYLAKSERENVALLSDLTVPRTE